MKTVMMKSVMIRVLTASALLLMATAACAGRIDVAATGGVGVVAVDATDGQCSLREAMLVGNGDAANDCASAYDGNAALTIILPANATFTLTDAPTAYDADGSNGLPDVTGTYTIAGHGDTITRSTAASTPRFRLLHVATAGNLTLHDVTLSHGYTPDVNDAGIAGDYDDYGGGLYNEGTLTIAGSTISNNTTGAGAYGGGGGGGLYNEGALTIASSTISANVTGADSVRGGGLLSVAQASVELRGSAIIGNTASGGQGGGVYANGQITIVNSTIADNHAADGGSALSIGGGTTNVYLSYVTVVDDGGSATMIDGFSTLTMDHSIVVATTGAAACHGVDVVSAGYNLTSDASCGVAAASDLPSTDPLLGPLADNGGPTWTMVPQSGSPAIDAVPLTDCTAGVPSVVDASVDQRGVTRPVGLGCDIGAVEVRVGATILQSLGGYNQHAMAGDPFEYPLVMQARDEQGRPVTDLPIAVAVPSSGASANCTAANTDNTGLAMVYCTANGGVGNYTVTLSVAAVNNSTRSTDFTLTNDFNDRIFGSGFEGALATMTLAANQNVADVAVTVPQSLLFGRIVPILVVHDTNGHRVSMVEARRTRDGTHVRSIDYDARGYPAHFGAWHVPASQHLQLHVNRSAGIAQTSLQASPR